MDERIAVRGEPSPEGPCEVGEHVEGGVGEGLEFREISLWILDFSWRRRVGSWYRKRGPLQQEE